ncbi:hypothetical protein PJK55_14705 [Exiguobacterium sp. MMG028]|uniref:hypothetical protein n=1 Tax=Exiguobacterium sp. MMG028 TaxID=3021979 RepID=UPI0022FDD507|nr:hypothetical protein [Exiguobacterium sp. MMG028]MDA5561987.1 hypothetical protein [Exiguobacterium sp. MMG028]
MKKIWSDELVRNGILDVIEKLNIKVMPTSTQVKGVTKDWRLHNAITKGRGYRGWAEELGLPLKSCETHFGNDYEELIEVKLKGFGYEVEQMPTKFPYDLLVNGTTKVDVKVGVSYYLRGTDRVVTFRTAKANPTCDFYITVRLNELREIEKIHVIPSHEAKVVSICMGENSKYDVYLDRYDLLKRHHEMVSALTLDSASK